MRRTLHTLFFAAAALVAGPALADAKADILASHKAMIEAGKFRLTSTNESKQGRVESTAEIMWPDRYHITSEQMEIIVLPGKTYMKQGGAWQPFPMDMSAMIKTMSPDAMKQGFDSMTNIKELGEKTVDGKTARGYEYDSTVTMMNVTAKSHVTMWVDADTNLPIRQEIDGEAMGMKSRTTQTYDFDSSIDIKAPM